MSHSAARNVRVALAIAVLIVYFGHQREVVVEAAPVVVTDWCFAVCDQNASCLDPCLVEQPELPGLEINCGMYDGGPANDWCDGNGCADQCAWWWSIGSDVCYWENEQTTCEDYGVFGYCGDNACVAAQGETCSNCPEDCSICPPGITCDNDSNCELGESWQSCPQDCEEPEDDWCGNGACGPEEDGTSCAEDCTFLSEWCNESLLCPNGWECIDNLCVWETYPLYLCCGGASELCLHHPSDCPVGTTCREIAHGINEDHACKPNLFGG